MIKERKQNERGRRMTKERKQSDKREEAE